MSRSETMQVRRIALERYYIPHVKLSYRLERRGGSAIVIHLVKAVR